MDNTTTAYVEEKNIQGDAVDSTNLHDSLCHLFNECAKQYPDKIAIKFNGRTLTFQSVFEQSNRLARLLAESGVKAGDIIGVAIDRSPEMIISLVAILKSGAAYLPLDPAYPKDRVEFMLKDSGAKMLITQKKHEQYFTSSISEILIEDAWASLNNYDASELDTVIGGDDLAYILYTSGSTGLPKGVLVTHHNMANLLVGMKRKPGISHSDKLLAISTISFDIAGLELFLPLISGACIVLADAETAKDGWLLHNLIETENITLMQATPYTWRMIIEAGWDDFVPLRIITGGEALSKSLATKLLWRCREVWNQYGPTETTVYSTQKLVTSADDITIGKPVANTNIYIVDEFMNNLTDGSTGEICIGGDGVAKGYHNRPDLTAERFIDNPFSHKPGDKIYRTGDLGGLNENGEIQCLGRIDHQVKVRGYRIEPDEIEFALLTDTGIKEAVVVVRTDKPDEPRIAAYMVLADGQPSSKGKKAAIKKMLLKTLPVYMVPDDFVFISAIPVTPNGKVDRKLLPKPGTEITERKAGYVAPRTEREKQLAALWEQLLGIEKIGINDNFFDLGGHSLVAVRLMARVEKLSGKRLPIATLLEYPTVEKLAGYLDGAENSTKWDSLVPIKPGGTKVPLYIIHGEGLNVLYFNTLAINMDNEQPVYGLQAHGLKGDAPLDVMEDIAANYVREIVAHNPHGPYFLAGYSFGGYIAVEMRKQLVAMGKEVKVIIFDTDAEKSKYKSWLYLFPRKVKRHLPRVISSAKHAMKHPVRTIGGQIKNVRKKLSEKPVESAESKKFYEQVKNIKSKLRVALHNYPIEPFDDKVYLYKAKICTHYVNDTQFLGWSKYAKKGVEINEVSGDHLSMLLPPHVEGFASVLQKGIDGFKQSCA